MLRPPWRNPCFVNDVHVHLFFPDFAHEPCLAARQGGALAFEQRLLSPLDGQAHDLPSGLVADAANAESDLVRAGAAYGDSQLDLALHADLDKLSHGPDLPAVLVGTIGQPFMLAFRPFFYP